MKVDLGIWDKLTKLVIFLLFIAGLMIVAVWYLPVIKQNERMRQRILALDGQIRKDEEVSRQLRASIDSLRNDPKAIERLARERFGYARTNETVIKFEAAPTNPLLRR